MFLKQKARTYQSRKMQLADCCKQSTVPYFCAEEYCKPSPTNPNSSSRRIKEVRNEIRNCKKEKYKICRNYFEKMRRCLESGWFTKNIDNIRKKDMLNILLPVRNINSKAFIS